MRAVVRPGGLSGTLAAPASKSDAHRCLIAAWLCDTPVEIVNLPASDDIAATRACLLAMRDASPLPCGKSATTLRLLLPVCGALGIPARFTGDGSLPGRPLAPLLEALARGGLSIDGDALPLSISGRLSPGEYALPGDVSSQFVSGLLLALPLLAGDSSIRLTSPLQSAGYVEMTRQTMARFSVGCDGFFVPGNQRYRSPGRVCVEGDWSLAAFFLAAGAIGGDVTVRGLSMASRQPDRGIMPLLEAFGARVSASDDAVRVRRSRLVGIEADVSGCPDLAPVLAVLGAAAQGVTRLMGTARLRLKESDRADGLCALVAALGGEAVRNGDALVIRGGLPLRGGVVDIRDDHRLVMAASIAALACAGPTEIPGAQAVRKSYPDFFDALRGLGGDCDVVLDR